jgi:drug/metabolite transporter (DMT)-like permease
VLTLGPASASAWAAAAPQGAMVVAIYVCAFLLLVTGMRATSAATAGIIYCLEPITAVAAAAVFLGERLSLAQYAGAALVLAGVAVEVGSRAFPPRRPQRA